ncbi:MAG: TlpA disulfide reductase family protein [Salibacteraceae bacterium]
MNLKQVRPVLYAITLLLLTSASCSEKSTTDGSTADGESTESGQMSESTMAQGEMGQDEKMKVEYERAPIRISGRVIGAQNAPIYLQIVESKGVRGLDTITAGPNGEYSFEYTAEIPQYYRVGMNEQNSFYLILAPGESAVANAKAANMFKSFEIVEGPEESYRMKEMNGITGMADSINMILQAAQMNKDQNMLQSAINEYENVNARLQREIKAFIKRKPASLSSLAALQNLNFDTEFDYYLEVINALDGIADGNDIYDNMKTQILEMKRVAVGAIAPEIKMSQPNGEVISLSELTEKNEYVLIDFWASWCGPCRRENPNVKRVYDIYHEKGFEILGVSLDKAMQPWLKAIGQDGLEWRHVSDLKYWQSSVVKDYQITGIPLTVLVDKDRRIIAKNLRGEALEIKLAQLLGE